MTFQLGDRVRLLAHPENLEDSPRWAATVGTFGTVTEVHGTHSIGVQPDLSEFGWCTWWYRSTDLARAAELNFIAAILL